MKVRLLIFIVLIISHKAFSDILPDYDTRCDSMLSHAADIDPSSHSKQVGYFNKKVPKNIHQIWFGDRARLEVNNEVIKWKEYAKKFHYKYKLWHEKDRRKIRKIMSKENYQLFEAMLLQQNWWAASDMLRLELIKRFGGIYVDCDFSPPTMNGRYVDLKKIINFHGLTLMTEHVGRNIHTSAIFVANGFIVCSPDHPVIISAIEQVAKNMNHWHQNQQNYDAMFVTGPFLLNKVLSGSFNVVPCLYLLKYNMYHGS